MGSLGSEKELDQRAHKSIHDNDDDAVPPAAASTCDHERFAEQIHYFAPPHSTTLKHVLILIFYHMLPFTLGVQILGVGWGNRCVCISFVPGCSSPILLQVHQEEDETSV